MFEEATIAAISKDLWVNDIATIKRRNNIYAYVIICS